MKKRGSALATVLLITAASLIICTAVVTASVNTTKFNAKYSSNIDLELVAKSALNIGREDLLSKINVAKETNDRSNLPEDYKVESNIINLLEQEQNATISVNISKTEETLNNSIKYVYTITANIDEGKKIETQSIIVNITLNSNSNIDDFVENMKYNVNVAGTLTSHNSNDKHNVLSGNVGYKETEGWKDNDNIPGNLDSGIREIKFDINKLPMSTLKIADAEVSGNLPKIIGGFRVYLVNGNVELIAPNNISNTIIISSGNVAIKGDDGNGSDNKIVTMNNSIIYCNSMNIENKKGLTTIGGTASSILNNPNGDSNSLTEFQVDELKSLLISVGFEFGD